MHEKERLSTIAETYTQFDKDMKVNKFRVRTIVSLCRGPRILELGCADGLVTEKLVEKFEQVVAVDGSQELLSRAQERAPKAEYVCALFEEYVPNTKQYKFKFNTIILGHVLEHVLAPVPILKRVKEWLVEDGVMIITVPNGESIHRRVGVELGMIKSVTELNEDDIRIGHRRVYTLATLKTDVLEAGLSILHAEGIMFKPLSNRQMFHWPDDLLDAYYRLAKKLPPEFGGELCLVCNKG